MNPTNAQLLFCIKANKQLVKLGKYFADFNFRGSRLTAKYCENLTTRKFPILRYLGSIISRLALSEISIFYLISVAEQAGLNLTFSETLKTGILSTRPIIVIVFFVSISF